MTKLVKLGAAGLLAAAIAVSYLFARDNPRFYQLRRCWNAAPNIFSCYGNRPFDFVTDFYGFKWEGNTENLIDRYTLYFGAFESPILHFLRDSMKTPGVFVDVGANSGQDSLFMSRHAKQVHAVEPYPPVLEKLRRHIFINKVTNIIVHPVGLGSHRAKLPFYKPPAHNLGTGSFVDRFTDGNSAYGELQIVRGDDLFSAIEVNLIKIDVEGFERHVLEGLRKTLHKSRPIVVFELSFAPGRDYGFTSIEQVHAAFPDNYKLLYFDKNKQNLRTGHYELHEFSRTSFFDTRTRANGNLQVDIVAYPAENEGLISRQP
ncbi:MAG TPA: FkbM family methyltransferase [Candidatus Acidoferrales bacterium]|nr:FkbM family methyltransferase [Candidatus Acidoferrales bacterium]